ncbi:MAG: PAS domain-containing protein [Alphaproteobacteria bacterium]|nr:MAG: PAS domain-containing protein [Alphaproteobacteria bacterium]
MMPAKTGLEINLLASVPHPVMAIAPTGQIAYVNSAAEQLFSTGASGLVDQHLSDILPDGNPLRSLVEQALSDGLVMREYDVEFSSPKTEPQIVDVQVAPIAGEEGVLATLQSQTLARKMDRQLTHRGAARSVSAMAAMLAHEIKNPLSGIKGAAQLLEQTAAESDKELTQLICDETDRIAGIVDRMEVFSDVRPPARDEVNIHDVLDHVRRVAQSGFARNLVFKEEYDPSLPPVSGDRDQLIQAILNLVKNAAEAVSDREHGEIILSTAYRQGVRMRVGPNQERISLPLEVLVIDNGGGIAEELLPYLFDPFVTTKTNGSGLGLALVAKIIGDHGGVIECANEGGKTVFRTLLPVMTSAPHQIEET